MLRLLGSSLRKSQAFTLKETLLHSKERPKSGCSPTRGPEKPRTSVKTVIKGTLILAKY